MKEADRKLQWCPHRRTVITIDPQPGPPITTATVAGNSVSNTSPPPVLLEIGTCIGSQCSQWRWEEDGLLRISAFGIPLPHWERDPSDGLLDRLEPLPRPPSVDPAYAWFPRLNMWIKPKAVGDREGHCGLSGAAPFG